MKINNVILIMKSIFFIALSFTLFCCSNKQEHAVKNKKTPFNNYCPENGICTLNVLQQSHLELKYDGTGALYPEISKGENVIIKMDYTRNKISNTQDSHYQEIIFLELPYNNLEVNLKNKQLKEVKLLFARLCFCKGKTGYYEITEGHLLINKLSNNTYNLNLNFTCNEVPQVLKEINETIVIK
ncbi:hypothetical protein [Mangrovimonas spongiae]|uniref:Uncharacterized protein n=1 Tax=Mangrovimonas spongiae TaxID=2494697 RepID=A0A3R9NTT7_9FLAO|nr:hypothetical protein [Mangrovimonas spongiae]RSK41581.1 hypothetical protein EJA19_01525 [Mangrovimonas spongiae]